MKPDALFLLKQELQKARRLTAEGQVEKALALLEDKSLLVTGVPADLKGNLLQLLGELWLKKGNPSVACPLLEEALESYREADTTTPWQTAETRLLLGDSLRQLKQPYPALEQYKVCFEAVMDGVLTSTVARRETLTRLGETFCELGKSSTALHYFKAAIKATARAEYPLELAHLYLKTGAAYRQQERLVRATLYYYMALKLYTGLAATEYLPQIKNFLGEVLVERHRFEEGEKLLTEALTAGQETSNQPEVSQANLSLAQLYFRQQKTARSESYARQALEISQSSGDLRSEGLALIQLAEIRQSQSQSQGQTRNLQDEHEEWKTLFEEGLFKLEGAGARLDLRKSYWRHFEALKSADYVGEAFRALERAYSYLETGSAGYLARELAETHKNKKKIFK